MALSQGLLILSCSCLSLCPLCCCFENSYSGPGMEDEPRRKVCSWGLSLPTWKHLGAACVMPQLFCACACLVCAASTRGNCNLCVACARQPHPTWVSCWRRCSAVAKRAAICGPKATLVLGCCHVVDKAGSPETRCCCAVSCHLSGHSKLSQE